MDDYPVRLDDDPEPKSYPQKHVGMKRKILLQLDCDSLASSFDAVVAVDAGIDFLLQYANVDESNVVGLVHGAMFTRGPEDLASTAIFIGGSSLSSGEAILRIVKKTLFDPFRVSVVLDSNGSNSTACAAVLCAMKHLDLANSKAVVLGATGAVGQRVAKLLAMQAAEVRVGSREIAKAQRVADDLKGFFKGAELQSFDYQPNSISNALQDADLVISCGAAGVELLTEQTLNEFGSLQVAIDLNAVPPAGLGGIKATDKATKRSSRIDYGALGVGGLKMKIHKAAICKAFEQRGLTIDAPEMLEIGKHL